MHPQKTDDQHNAGNVDNRFEYLKPGFEQRCRRITRQSLHVGLVVVEWNLIDTHVINICAKAERPIRHKMPNESNR